MRFNIAFNMKFSIQTRISNACSKSRLGKIYDLQRLPNVELETPLLLLHTKGGSVTNLTREVLHKVTNKVEALQIPLENSAKCYEGVKGFKGTISEFVGLKEYISYCTTYDPAVSTPLGQNTKSAISMWTVNGRKELTADGFMDMIEAFQPDMYEVMSDSDNNINSTVKRLKKSFDNSALFLLNCLSRHTCSKVLQKSAVLGVIEGGYDLQARERAIQHLTQHKDSLDGFVISGMHANGPEVESLTVQDVAPIVTHILKRLPDDKLRIIHGCWKPEVVIGLVDMGIDVFDSTLIDVVTERYSAFTFHWEASQRSCVSDLELNLEDVKQSNEISKDSCKDNTSYQLEICLKDSKYFDDFTPILDGCTCLACSKHTKAYIHHLYTTKELLGPLLLTIHNLHHYQEFFSFIRDTTKKGLSVKIR